MLADISRNASRLGARSGRLRELSILGGRGRSKQNAERDYHRMREADGMPIQTYFIYVPLLDANTGLRTEWEWLPVLLPWEIIFCLNTHGELPSLIGDACDASLIGAYWQEFLKQMDTEAHPIRSCSDTTDVIPLHWHVDGVEVTKSSGGHTSNYVFSWSSALVTGPSLRTNFF